MQRRILAHPSSTNTALSPATPHCHQQHPEQDCLRRHWPRQTLPLPYSGPSTGLAVTPDVGGHLLQQAGVSCAAGQKCIVPPRLLSHPHRCMQHSAETAGHETLQKSCVSSVSTHRGILFQILPAEDSCPGWPPL